MSLKSLKEAVKGEIKGTIKALSGGGSNETPASSTPANWSSQQDQYYNTPQANAPVDTSASGANRFGAFSGIREGAHVNFLVDGEKYFNEVVEALEDAKETIMIEDWWLSPQMLLRRPHMGSKVWRIDEILRRRAEAGVKVYIVLYKEMKLALSLNSRYVKDWMQGLNKNIRVLRHPDHLQDSVFYWAHHEKMCIIDSKIAFIGGLDLCFGRYDTHAHRLADPAEIMWPGQDYNNPRRKDFVNIDQYKITLIDRQLFPRMPWHDVSLRVTGLAAYDITRHFCERWNFIKNEKYPEKDDVSILQPNLYNAEEYGKRTRGTCRTQILRSSATWSHGINKERSIQDAYLDTIEKAQHYIYIENQFFISNASGNPKYAIANTIANALVKRIVRANRERKPFRVIVAMPLMPAFEADINDKSASTLRLVMHWQYMTISRGGNSIFELLRKEGIRPEDYITFYGLRNWDLIRDKRQYPPPSKAEIEARWHTELSDQKHEDARKESASFSFVPRFFKDLFGGDDIVETVQATEGEGKLEAKMDLEEDSLFVSELVYIHTKLMIVDDRYVICGSANINDRSMCGDRDSEIAIFVEDTATVDIRMAGRPYKAGKVAYELRNRIFREHLGIMPATDMEFICHLSSHVKPRMPTQQYAAYIERMNLVIEDPLSKQFWDFWTSTAKKNTAIYRRMFRCVPDDTVTSWGDYKAYVVDAKNVLPGHVVNKDMDKHAMQKELFEIQGHLVEFPTEFLRDEELKAEKWSAENLMPEDVFT